MKGCEAFALAPGLLRPSMEDRCGACFHRLRDHSEADQADATMPVDRLTVRPSEETMRGDGEGRR